MRCLTVGASFGCPKNFYAAHTRPLTDRQPIDTSNDAIYRRFAIRENQTTTTKNT